MKTGATMAATAAIAGLSLLAGAAGSHAAAGAAAAGPADLLLVNGAIYTQDERQPWVQALAVRDGHYVAVGANAAARRFSGPRTRVIDLHGRMLMPGLVDAHIHAVEGAVEDLYACIFPSTATAEQIRTRLGDCHRKAAPGEWLQGGSWDSDFFAHQQIASPRLWLDAIVGDRPVILRDDSHHNVWVNSAALRLAGVNAETPDPTGGSFEREADGRQPNGIALEAAAEFLSAAAPVRAPAELRRAVLHSQELAHRFGIIGLKEADAVEAVISAYHDVENAGQLTMYASSCISTLAQQQAPDTTLDLDRIERIHSAYSGPLMAVDCVKFYLDGVPTPARTAAMLDPYLPDAKGESTRGLLHVNPETLATDLIALDQRGYSVKMHAAGDGAIREGLDAVEATRKANGGGGQHHELAHAGFIASTDLGRFARLNVIADLSPVIWYPSPIIEAVTAAVGAERGAHYWPMRSLLAADAPMAAGSDWPSVVPSMDPWGGIEAMVTRADPYGASPATLWPEQAVSLADALRIYTLGGAGALGRERETGSIVTGKSADFIVLDHNLFKVPAASISDVRVDLTYFKGREVYRRVP